MGKVGHIISIVNIHASKENIYTSNQGRTQDLGRGEQEFFFFRFACREEKFAMHFVRELFFKCCVLVYIWIKF